VASMAARAEGITAAGSAAAGRLAAGGGAAVDVGEIGEVGVLAACMLQARKAEGTAGHQVECASGREPGAVNSTLADLASIFGTHAALCSASSASGDAVAAADAASGARTAFGTRLASGTGAASGTGTDSGIGTCTASSATSTASAGIEVAAAKQASPAEAGSVDWEEETRIGDADCAWGALAAASGSADASLAGSPNSSIRANVSSMVSVHEAASVASSPGPRSGSCVPNDKSSIGSSAGVTYLSIESGEAARAERPVLFLSAGCLARALVLSAGCPARALWGWC